MDSGSIRRHFLTFFKEKAHKIVPSAPLVVKNDPTLMFTNAGMNQFKDWFLGHSPATYKRVADTQKCLRVSGKHNDLEEVGIDTYHHTMFEMLGNWSFGDYFKKEAIEWAWDLLTKVYKLSEDRLYATVFGGDAAEGLGEDEEAARLWENMLPADRILRGSKKDNFWEMGDTGPCGPCSEIHMDLRSEADRKKTPGASLVNTGHPQVIEIWNLVFIEFNRKADGTLEKLPARHVDTGMGFERLSMAIQGKTSTYDTDVFTPLIDFISKQAGTTYGKEEKKDIAIRVLADHIRAVSFAVADGQLPSNTGAGYVIRRILRRAIRYGFSYLGFSEPFIYKLVSILADQMKDVFPELSSQQAHVSKVIQEEEISFLRTLEKGLRRFDSTEGEWKNKTIPGEVAFELYDTYGFPPDLTALIARERGLSVDMTGFEKEMEKQKSRSRTDAVKETGDWLVVFDTDQHDFVGYDELEADVRLVKYRKVKQKNKELFQLVFDKTPFYAESGGQVGDTGWIEAEGKRINILDTKKENQLIIHFAEQLPANPGAVLHAVVDRDKRQRTMNNHSATHLLHAALREVLGNHVEQRGSLVNDTLLRFDFSHFAAMTPEEIRQVEDHVNEKIRENIPLNEQRNVPLEKAKAMGAMALFGEKYGEFVRVITFDSTYSVELCGGTHVPATGTIGLFKIVSEGSVAAGVRRIEAVTANEAERYVRDELELLGAIRELLKNPKNLIEATKGLISDRQELQKKLEQVNREQVNKLAGELAGKVSALNGFDILIERVKLPDADSLKQIAYGLKGRFDNLLLILAAEVGDKPMVAVMVSDKLVEQKKFDAGKLVKDLAKEIDGGGGGQPFFATAGGKNLNGLDAVIKKANDLIRG